MKRVPAIVFLFIMMAFLASPAMGAHNKGSGAGIAGDAFTDPAKTFPMPSEWMRKPIEQADWGKGADITIMLEQDVFQTIYPLIRKYEKERGIKIALKEGTCGIAAGMLSKKTVDMGGFCCAAGYEDRLPGLRYHTLGIVSKAFFVNPENPIDSLTIDQIRNIYMGKAYKWSEFRNSAGKPGPDRAIKAVARLHCEKRPGHWRLLLDENRNFGTQVFEVGSIPDMISTVVHTREAMGWEVLSMIEKYKELGAVRTIKLGGYAPTDSEALATLKYPLYRVYTITTWDAPGTQNKKADALVKYLVAEMERLDPKRFGFVSPTRLRQAGWKFVGDELVGEPK